MIIILFFIIIIGFYYYYCFFSRDIFSLFLSLNPFLSLCYLSVYLFIYLSVHIYLSNCLYIFLPLSNSISGLRSLFILPTPLFLFASNVHSQTHTHTPTTHAHAQNAHAPLVPNHSRITCSVRGAWKLFLDFLRRKKPVLEAGEL